MFAPVFVVSGGNSAWCERLFFDRFHKNRSPQSWIGKMQRRSFCTVHKTSGYVYSICFNGLF